MVRSEVSMASPFSSRKVGTTASVTSFDMPSTSTVATTRLICLTLVEGPSTVMILGETATEDTAKPSAGAPLTSPSITNFEEVFSPMTTLR